MKYDGTEMEKESVYEDDSTLKEVLGFAQVNNERSPVYHQKLRVHSY